MSSNTNSQVLNHSKGESREKHEKKQDPGGHYTHKSITTQYKMTTEIPAGIITPDRVETRLGTLRFFDGFPDEATVQTVYDNLDFQRATQAFLTSMLAAWHHALRTAYRIFGPDNQTLLITESLMDSRTLYAAANIEMIYNLTGWIRRMDHWSSKCHQKFSV